jgi:hypothetical protein
LPILSIQLLFGRTVGAINRSWKRDGSKSRNQLLPEPASDTYDSAQTFPELMFKPKKARRWVKRLKKAGVSEYAEKDILRASAIPIATVRAYDWKNQQDQIRHGEPLSPFS